MQYWGFGASNIKVNKNGKRIVILRFRCCDCAHLLLVLFSLLQWNSNFAFDCSGTANVWLLSLFSCIMLGTPIFNFGFGYLGAGNTSTGNNWFHKCIKSSIFLMSLMTDHLNWYGAGNLLLISQNFMTIFIKPLAWQLISFLTSYYCLIILITHLIRCCSLLCFHKVSVTMFCRRQW